MKYQRILTIQDISCVGQCSLTVALPILSACGLETAILPSAVLSTHTAGFSGYTVRDLTEDLSGIAAHWEKENIDFSAVYTGYLGSTEQIALVREIMDKLLRPDGLRIVDPAMADNGKLYPAFDLAYAKAMAGLCAEADYILPNITEACFLTGAEYRERYDETYVRDLTGRLRELGAKTVVLTGVGYTPDTTGVVVDKGGALSYYQHRRLPKGSHGTGDIYASAFTGALLSGCKAPDAARIAADFTLHCIEETQARYPDHWYGVAFEPLLPELAAALR